MYVGEQINSHLQLKEHSRLFFWSLIFLIKLLMITLNKSFYFLLIYKRKLDYKGKAEGIYYDYDYDCDSLFIIHYSKFIFQPGSMYEQFCEFCQILRRSKHAHKSSQDAIIYEDQQFFVFHDINKATARQHILICTKEHIETALEVHDSKILFDMREVGVKVLNSLVKRNCDPQKDYRFGFHLRPFNSISHIHLHGFLLPFQSYLIDKVTYGWMLKSIEQVVDKLQILNKKLNQNTTSPNIKAKM